MGWSVVVAFFDVTELFDDCTVVVHAFLRSVAGLVPLRWSALAWQWLVIPSVSFEPGGWMWDELRLWEVWICGELLCSVDHIVGGCPLAGCGELGPCFLLSDSARVGVPESVTGVAPDPPGGS